MEDNQQNAKGENSCHPELDSGSATCAASAGFDGGRFRIRSGMTEGVVILLLLIFCYFMFFHGIGTYPLMDVDETRYVAIARDMFLSKDFLTLRLNDQFFFEKPPLYFWMECLSFAVFGKINEFSARIPAALCSTASVFLLYFVGKKAVSRNFGIIAAMILAASLEFVMLGKFAILDITVSTCVGFSVMFGFLTFFCQEHNKKYFWWLFYIFSGLAVMAKGIPGFVVPFGVMFFASIYMKKFKEIFRPQYMVPGAILFFAIVIPWHVVMMKIHGQLFFDEYIIKHHLQRFTGGEVIHRDEPFYFYILTFLWGFFPWTLPAIAVGVSKIIETNKDPVSFRTRFGIFHKQIMDKFHQWKMLKQVQHDNVFLICNVIAFAFIFLFFSSSKTKLITYILPVYFFSACLMACVWNKYITDGEHKKPINIATYILSGIFLVAAVAAVIVPYFLPQDLAADISIAKWPVIILLSTCGVWGIYSVKKDRRVATFGMYVFLMLCLSAFLNGTFFKIDYKFGQDDLMKYAKFAKEHDSKLASFGFGNRYSLLYYYGTGVEMIGDKGDEGMEILRDKLASDYLVVIKNKNAEEFALHADFKTLDKGRKYSLVRKN